MFSSPLPCLILYNQTAMQELNLASPSQAGVARKMVGAMPQRALDIIMRGKFSGADLVCLASEVHRPSFKVLEK